jgi:hypothetical protein
MAPQHPFQSIRWHGNVVFNWRKNPFDDLVAFAVGYRRAAQHLAASIESANGYSDNQGYPILFLYRHALELYLKAVLVRAAKLAHVESGADTSIDPIWREHSLVRLFSLVELAFRQLDGRR